jgi:hypothetical protein
MSFAARIALALSLASVPLATTAQSRKYDVKSGIVTYQSVTTGAANLTKKVVVTFDDYGAKERRDEYQGSKLKTSSLSDDVRRYRLQHDKKTAFDLGAAIKGRGTELRFAWDEVSEADKKEGRAKLLPSRAVAGKTCEAYELKTSMGPTSAAGFAHVTLFFESTAMGMTTTLTAVSFQENPAVPPGTFAVPAGWTTRK